MTSTPDPTTPAPERPSAWQRLHLDQILTWGAFLVLLYLLRHFFFIIFMTFIVTYILRSMVGWGLGILAPGRERLWLDRLLTLACFALILLLLYGTGSYVGPRLFAQGEKLVARLSQVQPREEFDDLLAKTLGAYLMRRELGPPLDPRYQRAFREFLDRGIRLRAYRDFPALEATIESPFDAMVKEEEAQRIEAEFGKGGPLDRDFRDWFLAERAPSLYGKQKRRLIADWEDHYRDFAKMVPGTPDLETLKQAPDFESKRDEQILERLYDETFHDPVQRATYQKEWAGAVARRIEAALEDKESAAYLGRFQDYYEEQRQKDPAGFLYPFAAYMELKAAYARGEGPFAEALKKIEPQSEDERREQARADWEQSERLKLAQDWMKGPAAAEIKNVLSRNAETWVTDVAAAVRASVRYAITVPLQVALSLILALFIALDIPRMKRALGGLEQSRVGRVYREIAPSVQSFGQLMGRAFEAQGIFALVNTLLTFFLVLLAFGIENEVLLAVIVFVSSFVPVAGAILSAIPIALVALVQSGGSLGLAGKAVLAIIVIHFAETTWIYPKILGDMLHLHPVLVLAVLALGEYFFGLWGLLLAVPVTVYVIRHVIWGEKQPSPPGSPPDAATAA